MRRVRLLLAAAASLGVLALAAPSAVAADPVSDAEAQLHASSVYMEPSVTGLVKLNRDAVVSALPEGVKIAVLPLSVGSPTAVAKQIGLAIDPRPRVVGVFTAGQHGFDFGAGSSVYCTGWAGERAASALAANRAQMVKTHDVTELLSDFANSVKSGPLLGSSACGGAGAAASGAKKDSGGSAWPWIIGIGVVGAGGIAGLMFYRRRQRKRELETARAKVMPYYDRLANEVNTIEPADNDVAVRAMADASERYEAAGMVLDTADSVEKYAQARRATLEGLYAARTARKALDLDEGEPLPPVADTAGDQLSEPQEVTVQGKSYQGYPDYRPGAPYYYGGGYGVPGGWYSTPFWETLLIGSVLAGGFGGWGGGGYGAGYDSGYEAGRDSADTSSGGDWGSGGGDWGSGGGDWGGGGGDWGGGGGSDSGGSW
jgi:hypothetical protein